MRRQISALAVPFALFTTAVSADAAPITVLNPSFEAPVAPSPPGFTTTGPTNWTDVVATGDTRSIVQIETGTNIPLTAGTQWFILDSRNAASPPVTPGAVYQQIGDADPFTAATTIAPSTIYTLTFVVGDRSDTPLPSNFIFGLYSGVGPTPTTALATVNKTDVLALGLVDATSGDTADTVLATVTFDSATLPAAVGQNLFIQFAIPTANGSGSTTAQVLVDDVNLSAVPEPATAGLLGTGALMLMSRRRRTSVQYGR